MRISEIVLQKNFDLEKFLKTSTAKKIKFVCVLDIFGKQTLSFKNQKDYKKFKNILDDYISAERFIKELKQGKYNKILGGDFNELRKNKK